MEQRTPIGSFTTMLNAEELVECMNTNPLPKEANPLFASNLVWLRPTKYTDGTDVIYWARDPKSLAFILDNGVAEMYNYVGLDTPYTKSIRKHYQSVCS